MRYINPRYLLTYFTHHIVNFLQLIAFCVYSQQLLLIINLYLNRGGLQESHGKTFLWSWKSLDIVLSV